MNQVTTQQLTDGLLTLQSVYAGAGKGSPAASIRRVLELVEASDARTVEQLAAELRERRARPKRPAAANTVRTTVVTSHIDALRAAGLDQGAFDGALADLQSDRQVRVAELKEIVRAYVGGAVFKTKKAGFEAIRGKFRDRRLASSEREASKKAFVW